MDVTYLATLSSCSQDFVSDCMKLIQLQDRLSMADFKLTPGLKLESF